MKTRRHILLWGLLLCAVSMNAQKFFNLTANEVRIDSLLPVFNHTQDLGANYADSTWQVSIEYPEFIPMSATDIERYHSITDEPLKAMPEISQSLCVERKKGRLLISFVPLVYRNGQYLKLVSFMLKVKGNSLPRRTLRLQAQNRAAAASSRYAENSVLNTGNWAKIRVSSTGFHQLTSDLIRQAGFSDLSKVKIYGYGGALQPEQLTGDYLAATDDLKEVPTYYANGKKVFYAVGPVSWDSNRRRVRNPYSNYGYYFLTENDSEAATIDKETLLSDNYPQADDYCTLYEVDNYAWFRGGRNLYDAQELTGGNSYKYSLASTGTTAQGRLTVSLSAANAASINVSLNGTDVGKVTVTSISSSSHDVMHVATGTFNVSNLEASNEITLTPTATSATVRLDYISINASKPKEAPDVDQTLPTPEYVYRITNQNHHAATAADMVIIIPMTQKLLAQAERLKALHTSRDGLRVQIVPADELFNEFSSGTPDANAYRRYLKMLYDRAETDADMPRYLLLLGDGAWDNRMLLSDWKSCSPDDFLLCYESENSYSSTDCYVTDDYFCLMDDGEGKSIIKEMADVAVGRIPARTADEAAIAVNKIESYVNNEEAGAWQNLLCFMGDDGNNNQHMDDADSVACMIETIYPKFQIKRIMWDAYTLVNSATGHSYPDVSRLIRQQMQQGALLMNYSGHGRFDAISHEYVLSLDDFKVATSMRLPLWMTASCDIMPFDGQEENIGEEAFFNSKGGAIAFYGTTRTVFQNYNRLMNITFTRHVLSTDDQGRPSTIGEAARAAKNELISTGVKVGWSAKEGDIYSFDTSANKLQYTLLGDPALRLAFPTQDMEVTSINSIPMSDGTVPTLEAGSTAVVKGRVLNADGETDTNFNGVATVTVRDVEEKITCKQNSTAEAEEPFVFYDRPNTVFSGNNTVENGEFTFTFAVPKDIKYSDLRAMMNMYAINTAKSEKASGVSTQLVLNGTASNTQGTQGPNIYCYLNSPLFTNGGNVNTTPYFVAELNDEDGINASGSGIGHDLQIIIDGDMTKTYTLNDYFKFDFGSYTKGTVGYCLPELSYGQHKLLFRAWDILNNSSTTELTFNVVKGLEPVFVDVECTPNPARTTTSFRIVHDRIGSNLDVKIEIFDTAGRQLWSHTENGVTTDNTYTINWDLTVDGGRPLQTGLYLYRLSISNDGSTYASKAKKLIVLRK